MLARLRAVPAARPVPTVTAALAAGLVAGPRWPALLLVGAVAVAVVMGTPVARAAVLAAAVAGALVGGARLAAADEPALAPWIGHAVRAHAVITTAPEPLRWGGWRAVVRLDGPGRGGAVLLRVPGPGRAPATGIGTRLVVAGGLRGLRPPERYLRDRGVRAAVQAESVRVLGVRGGAPGALDGVRRRAGAALAGGVPAPEGALLTGMVLGDAAGLDAADQEALRRAGLTHLVAASGANVALLASMVLLLAAAAGVGHRPRLLAALAAVALYVPLAGGGPPVQRAGVMGGAALLAAVAGRASSRWQSLWLAVIATVLLQPRAPGDVGWQLSFAAVLAILGLGAPLTGALRRARVPAPVAAVVAVTVAATVATAPILALRLDRVAPVSLPANVLAAPAVAPAMWLGAAAAVAGQWAPGAAAAPARLAAVPAGYVLAVGRTAARVPPAVAWPLAAAMLAAAAGVALGAAAGHRRGWWRPVAVGTLVAGLLAAGIVRLSAGPGPAPDRLQVAFLDVGQGDATLVRHGPHAILVDGGPPGGPVVDRLRALGVRSLDVLAVTHAQADHDGGAAGVLAAVPTRLLLDGRDGVRDVAGARMAAAAGARGVRTLAPHAGMRVRAGPMVLDVLWPPPTPAPPGTDPNDRAMVALVRDGPLRVLLTADAESPVTAPLVTGPVDVLKVAHHGSADDALPAALAVLRPRVAGIEAGAGNPYGHPVPATIAALRRGAGVVLRTDRDGTVVVSAVGGRLLVRRHAA